MTEGLHERDRAWASRVLDCFYSDGLGRYNSAQKRERATLAELAALWIAGADFYQQCANAGLNPRNENPGATGT